MRIAQYGIKQYARNSTYQTQRVTRKIHLASGEKGQSFANILAERKPRDKEQIVTAAKNDLIDTLIAILSNQKIPAFKPLETPLIEQPQLITTTTHTTVEHAEMSFVSTGIVQTEDGKNIDFTCQIEFSKSYLSSVSSQVSSGKLIDPLVINLDNKGMALSDKKIKMDLNLDGHIDTFNMLKEGSGFLVLDKNNNGKVDDGSELFGPQTDDGFAELLVYDKDGNLWIDENDEIFKDLKVWLIDSDGNEKLVPLKETGVGAIYLDHVSSDFDLKETNKKGKITHSGIFLREDGSSGSIHEVKL